MNTYARWAVAAIAVVLAIGGTAYFLAPGGGVGSPTAAPSPSPSSLPSPTASVVASATPSASAALPSASPAALAAEGFVYPGTYTPAFDPGLTFTIAREVEHQCAPGFRCRGSIDANLPGWLSVEFGQPRIEVGIFRVDKVNDPAHPSKLIDPPDDLAGWIAQLPGITLAAPAKAVKVGGLAATQLDIVGGSKDVTIGPIPGVTDPRLGIGANTRPRFIALSVNGHHVLIYLNAQEAFAFEAAMYELQPLVDSIVWR